MALSMSAQRCAVLEFKAGVGISQADVDGISAIFITYFRPAGYTMVERTQIDKAIDEQGFQRSKMTESQMVRIGQILNVSKIVVGDVNVVMGQYNVDARVINVESGTITATEGATFAGTSYRTTMQSIAQKLASKIAITSGATVTATPTQQNYTVKKRTTVEVVYGYLKVFPNEIGVFEAEPASIIRQINNQAQHGYNNWRIPTNEELSLLRANGYVGQGKYMTKESRSGIVLLVTDGRDAATLQAEAEEVRKEEARRAEEIRKAEEARKAKEAKRAEDAHRAALRAQGWIDLGLPSGTLWKDRNEAGGFYSYDQAMAKFGNSLPTKEQLEELNNSCTWDWNGNGYKVTGPNGEFIILSATSFRDCFGNIRDAGGAATCGLYWSSSPNGSNSAWRMYFLSNLIFVDNYDRCGGFSVRLVRK